MSETPDQIDSQKSLIVPRGTVLTLRQLVMLLTTVVVGIVLLLAAISFRLFTQHTDELMLDHGQQQLQIAHGTLVRQLGFYHDLLHAYATDPDVRDILVFGDRNRASSWSRQVRAALPQAIGAGLFTADGEVLGEPETMRIGRACLNDMAQRVAGHAHDEFPIHGLSSDLEHFDMAVPVVGDGRERLGLVFVSFSLRELGKALDELSSVETAVALTRSGSDTIIAASSNWTRFPVSAGHSLPVPDSRWVLQMRVQENGLLPALPSFGAAILTGAAVLIAVMLFFHRLLMRGYLFVIEDLRQAIRGISEGETVDEAILARGSQLFSVSDHLGDDLTRLSVRHEHLHLESRTDVLTGLSNRRVFDEGLDALRSAARDRKSGFVVLLMDLDGFKLVNDRFGHACGDLVLKALATAITNVVRDNDLASRWGGDEFALLMPHMQDIHVEAWIHRLRHAFKVAQSQTLELPEEAHCGVSCGYLFVGEDDTRDADDLLRDADQALYENKRERKAQR